MTTWTVWIGLGLLIAVITGATTLIWWKVGDQWANEEYKKFGHGGGSPKGPAPTVISDFDSGFDSDAPKSNAPISNSDAG